MMMTDVCPYIPQDAGFLAMIRRCEPFSRLPRFPSREKCHSGDIRGIDYHYGDCKASFRRNEASAQQRAAQQRPWDRHGPKQLVASIVLYLQSSVLARAAEHDFVGRSAEIALFAIHIAIAVGQCRLVFEDFRLLARSVEPC